VGATPQSGWEKIPPLPADFKPKISYEEFKALVRELHQAMMEHDPNYDLDAELEAEHQAILNGADL
jgi:hypothetical protein